MTRASDGARARAPGAAGAGAPREDEGERSRDDESKGKLDDDRLNASASKSTLDDDIKSKLSRASRRLESVKASGGAAESKSKFAGSLSDFDEHDDDELVAGVLTKKATKNVLLLVALVAAVASGTYLVTMVSMNAERGLADVLYTLVFDDVWANIAITVLVLYTGAIKKAVEFALTTTATFVRPTRVNMLWWVSLFCLRSITHVTNIIRNTFVWSLGNQIWSLIPLGIDLIKFDPETTADGVDHVHSLLTTMFDANNDGVVTTTEVQMWFVAKTLRLLWCFYFLDLSRWFMSLKAAPTIQEMRTRGTSYDREDFLSQALRHHYAGLRGDRGVSWDSQARSALIDKALTVATYLLTSYWCLSALGVNMTGLLAVGGVSGIAVGFAAQKLVSNCIGGILIFVTQPFVEGDHVQFGSIDGRVEMVGWHSTRIASIDDGYSYIVPNTDVLGSALKNISRREYVPIKLAIPFPDYVKSKSSMEKYVADVKKIVFDKVDDWSVRAPVVNMEFDGLTPKIRIKAFIDGSKDKNKASDLEVQLMGAIVEKMHQSSSSGSAA